MTRQIVIVLDDDGATTSERYLDLLFEELQSLLATKGLQLVSINEKGDSEKSPSRK